MWTKLLLGLLTFLPLALGTCTATGCMTLDPAGQIEKLMASPAVQATLDSWSTRGSLHNPRIGFAVITGGELYTVGVDAEGTISGDARSRGIDPGLLRVLTDIAVEHGYVPPTTQPVK